MSSIMQPVEWTTSKKRSAHRPRSPPPPPPPALRPCALFFPEQPPLWPLALRPRRPGVQVDPARWSVHDCGLAGVAKTQRRAPAFRPLCLPCSARPSWQPVWQQAHLLVPLPRVRGAFPASVAASISRLWTPPSPRLPLLAARRRLALLAGGAALPMGLAALLICLAAARRCGRCVGTRWAKRLENHPPRSRCSGPARVMRLRACWLRGWSTRLRPL